MAFDHTFMHTLTVILAVVLFSLSAIAYWRNKKPKFLFICGAFLAFAVKECILVYQTFTNPQSMTLFGHEHILNLVVLLLFAFGVLRK
jgi:hypothetical protein